MQFQVHNSICHVHWKWHLIFACAHESWRNQQQNVIKLTEKLSSHVINEDIIIFLCAVNCSFVSLHEMSAHEFGHKSKGLSVYFSPRWPVGHNANTAIKWFFCGWFIVKMMPGDDPMQNKNVFFFSLFRLIESATPLCRWRDQRKIRS